MRSANLVSANASDSALAWVRWNMARLQPAGYCQAIELLCGDDLLRYCELQVPCQVHCGSADSITTADDCRALAQAFGAPFRLIHGAGHACAIEQPETVTGRLARALTPLSQVACNERYGCHEGQSGPLYRPGP